MQNKTNNHQFATNLCKTTNQNVYRSKTQTTFNRLAYFYLRCKVLDFFPYLFYKSSCYPRFQFTFLFFIFSNNLKQIVRRINYLFFLFSLYCNKSFIYNSYKYFYQLFYYTFILLFYKYLFLFFLYQTILLFSLIIKSKCISFFSFSFCILSITLFYIRTF